MYLKKSLSTLLLMLLCATTAQAREWGLHFEKNSNEPMVDAPAEELATLDAYYRDLSGDMVLYLTFDAGYEAGYTEGMIDTLNRHKAHGTFFLTASYIKNNPDIVRRMVAEGHTVANHTVSHPNMSQLSREQFAQELLGVEEIFHDLTEIQLPKYFRPPQGAYHERSLALAKELGYKTIFWSLAYMDFDKDNQPSHHTAYKKLVPPIHPGAIILLHNMSRTNAEILDGLLTQYTQLGYTFESLERFIRHY